MGTFYENIKPHVEQEIKKSEEEMAKGNPDVAYRHLENAHVLGQNAMTIHVKVHYRMLLWGINQGDFREIVGQTLRIPGTILFTWLNRLPTGNTGGARVPMFQKMDISEEHLKIINEAREKAN